MRPRCPAIGPRRHHWRWPSSPARSTTPLGGRPPPRAWAELARTLDHAHRRRLASWLLGVCPALFRLGDEPDLGFLTRDLVHAVLPAVGLGTALRRCRMLGHWTLLETMVPGGFGPRVDAY